MWRTIFKAKWSAVVIGCFRSEFYIAVHYHGNGSIVSSFFFFWLQVNSVVSMLL